MASKRLATPFVSAILKKMADESAAMDLIALMEDALVEAECVGDLDQVHDLKDQLDQHRSKLTKLREAIKLATASLKNKDHMSFAELQRAQKDAACNLRIQMAALKERIAKRVVMQRFEADRLTRAVVRVKTSKWFLPCL